ncbi:aminopeptidase [Dehalococcoides mccartyi]|jgi:Xaa-Pro aminopeptidase|uniref:M24 family metallopeptidase n=1 Tax=Dehalococcoides mccartyi TaxID=61435 RepID=UPI00099BB9D7|nr:aminopeptidase P family protein [Dehalococcoides mccartyi]AQX74485.1 aminopeptidase [Dehalococcoides mccartyi]AQY73063.1 aminopeptidase [Dehalococcoides mccartyi]
MSQSNGQRLALLRKLMAENELDGLLVSKPENQYYLSGFSGGEGHLFITPTQSFIAVDFRYYEQAENESPDYTLCKVINGRSLWLPELLSSESIRRLGFESSFITFEQYSKLKNTLSESGLNVLLVETADLAGKLRKIKSENEIDCIKQASAIGDAAFSALPSLLTPGMTERELAWELEKFMKSHGSQSMPFEVIAATGANSALPHAQTRPEAVADGQPLLMDYGAKFSWYASDMTRTVLPGKPNSQFKKIYDIVLAAQQKAIDQIHSGMTGQEADAIAREVIEKAGYGANFGHSLGHGVGLEVHEEPHLSPRSTDILENGMVFSIEPGIYLPGWGGIRIEDTCMLKNGKIELLSKSDKQNPYI